MSTHDSNVRPAPDQALTDMAHYVESYAITSPEAYRMARYCLIDSLGCAVESLHFPECVKLLGPIMPGTLYPNGVKVPGTRFELEKMPVENRVWLPKRFFVQSRARILFLFTYGTQEDETYFNYRKVRPLQTGAGLEEQVAAAKHFLTTDLP